MKRSLKAFAATAAFLPAPVLAQTSAGAPAAHETVDAFDVAVLGTEDLRSIAGREDVGVLVAKADQRNVVSNNSVTGTSVTGGVSIDGNAFQNLQGMAVISANSGNNVAMNAAMNVTINMAPR